MAGIDGADGARDAVRAGCDSVEHAIEITDEVLAEMVKRGVFYVPTIDHNRYYVESRVEYGYDEKVTERLNAYIDKNLQTARRAHKAGVKFAMGSDAVFTDSSYTDKLAQDPRWVQSTTTRLVAGVSETAKEFRSLRPLNRLLVTSTGWILCSGKAHERPHALHL